jgi:hypothetical protein
MSDFDQQLQRYSTIARLLGLISSTPQGHFLKVLKQFLGETFTKYLFKMVIEMSDDQQRLLLQKLEGLRLDNGQIEKRGHPRKSCLISVTYTVKDRENRSFILDISAFGVFIETKEALATGQEIRMIFTIPGHRVPFQLTGEIVWSGSQGIGVKFRYLTQFQLQVIQSFSEKMEEIYEIIS